MTFSLANTVKNPFSLDHEKVSEIREHIPGRIAKIIQSVTYSIQNLISPKDQQEAIYCVKATFPETNTSEGDIQNTLQDYNGTFPIFIDSVSHACKEMKNGKKKIAVSFYIDDARKPEFISVLQTLIQDWFDPWCFMFDLRADDHWFLDSRTIENLRTLKKLWFQFSLHDFELDGEVVDYENTEKLIHSKVIPHFLFITTATLEAIKRGVIRWYHAITHIIHTILKSGSKIIQKTDSGKSGLTRFMKIEDIPMVDEARIIDEPIFDQHGNVQAKELLVRFGNNISVKDGLEELKESGATLSLLKKAAKNASHDVRLGRKRSVNVYLRDLADPRIGTILGILTNEIHPDMRKNFIFEILEDHYGTLNKRAIHAIKTLRKHGFSIAIDDLHVGENISLSKDILRTLSEEGVSVQYIKLDGNHTKEILEGTMSKETLQWIYKLFLCFSHAKQPPIIIAEWIQDSEHARKVYDIFHPAWLEIWFQWYKLQAGNFRI